MICVRVSKLSDSKVQNFKGKCETDSKVKNIVIEFKNWIVTNISSDIPET